jgi:hypothetical protein
MPTSRNILAEAIEVWRALSERERLYVLDGIELWRHEPGGTTAALALLRAAAEPEAKFTCCVCGEEAKGGKFGDDGSLACWPCYNGTKAAEPEAKDDGASGSAGGLLMCPACRALVAVVPHVCVLR